MIKIKDNTGIGLREAVDDCLRDLMKEYSISRTDARYLLAEAITRNCVWDEIIATCNWLVGRDNV